MLARNIFELSENKKEILIKLVIDARNKEEENKIENKNKKFGAEKESLEDHNGHNGTYILD
jgi:hypothetical protein